MNQYDVIIIGGGHNGLTAATLLAGKGKKVLMLEKRSLLGGIAAGEEFYPGFSTVGLLHDTSCVRSQIVQQLGLEKYGLQTTGKRDKTTLISKDGKAIVLSSDDNETASQIRKYSEKDAESYHRYRQFIKDIGRFIIPLFNDLPSDLVNLGRTQLFALGRKGWALKKLGNRTMTELLKVAPMSVADFLDEWFETDFLKAGLAAPALQGSYTGPLASYSTLNLLLHECLAVESVIGGPQSLIRALSLAAESAGVDIMMDTEVESISLDSGGRVSGVKVAGGAEYNSSIVASSVAPVDTFLSLLKPNQVVYSLSHNIEHYRCRGTTAKVNLAIKGALEFTAETIEPVEWARTGNTFLDMEKASDPVKYGEFANDLVLDIRIPSLSQHGLAPPGHQVVSVLVHYVPYELKGGWTDDSCEMLGKAVISSLSKYIKGIETMIIGKEVLSPSDLESRYSLPTGHIYHGEHAVDQLLTRPIPACARYDTPIPGLYLCGSGSFPGGGVTGAPGYLAAKRILST